MRILRLSKLKSTSIDEPRFDVRIWTHNAQGKEVKTREGVEIPYCLIPGVINELQILFRQHSSEQAHAEKELSIKG